MNKIACIILMTFYSAFIFASDVSNEKYNFSSLDLNQDGSLSEAEYNMSRIGMSETEILKRTVRMTSNSAEFSAFELYDTYELNDQDWLPDSWLDEH